MLEREPNATIEPLATVPLPPSAIAGPVGLQILPGRVDRGPAGVTDGFHYVCLQR